MVLVEYILNAATLYLGERPKGEIFKPCIRTIPFSQVTGALNRKFGRTDFKAVGYLIESKEHNHLCYLTYSPRERVANFSKIPLQIEYLNKVMAKVFILANDAYESLDNKKKISLTMGGMRSRGFGQCNLTLTNEHSVTKEKICRGLLLTRIPCYEQGTFSLEIISPNYGYLFRPIEGTYTGSYIKSLFEGSIVLGPSVIVKPQL